MMKKITVATDTNSDPTPPQPSHRAFASAEHTPGPWVASGDGYKGWTNESSGYAGVITATNGTEVYRGPAAFWSLRGDTESEAIANANLMAAAPDLLKAVEAMLEEYEEGRNIQPFDIREMCRKAKFKAYGQSYSPCGVEVKR